MRYSDVPFPEVLRFIYDDSGKNIKIIEEIYDNDEDKITHWYETIYTYDINLNITRLDEYYQDRLSSWVRFHPYEVKRIFYKDAPAQNWCIQTHTSAIRMEM